MTWLAIILCEGAHDQKAISAFAQVCDGWTLKEGVPRSLPQDLEATFPTPTRASSGAWRFEYQPDYLFKGDRYLVVRNLGGVDNLLGQLAIDCLEPLRPNAIGVVVDANEVGVAGRVGSFRDVYSGLHPHAKYMEPGSVSGGNPPLGLWVAPDNHRDGRLDDLLIDAASRKRRGLVERGRRFVGSVAKVEPGKWTSYRNKAVLGAINQVVQPGASLAVSLRDSSCWFDEGLAQVTPFKELLQFLKDLTGA